jgi:phosphohistidine phosphatase
MDTVRTVYLLRHAKSSWDDPGLPDRDRVLAPRGRKAARRIADYLERERIRPDLVLCSPAARTRETLERIGDALGEPEVVFDERLYGATDDELLSCLREASPAVSSIMLVGHNPGIADLMALLAERRSGLPDAVPTGALVTLRFAAESWGELGASTGKLDGFVVPRELP